LEKDTILTNHPRPRYRSILYATTYVPKKYFSEPTHEPYFIVPVRNTGKPTRRPVIENNNKPKFIRQYVPGWRTQLPRDNNKYKPKIGTSILLRANDNIPTTNIYLNQTIFNNQTVQVERFPNTYKSILKLNHPGKFVGLNSAFTPYNTKEVVKRSTSGTITPVRKRIKQEDNLFGDSDSESNKETY
jgi:hypothetical protein